MLGTVPLEQVKEKDTGTAQALGQQKLEEQELRMKLNGEVFT